MLNHRLLSKLAYLFLTSFLIVTCSKSDEPVKYGLTTSISGAEGGVITPATGSFSAGQRITITAVPEVGYVFDRWGGSSSATENPLNITITANTQITATFKKADTDGDGISDDIDTCADTAQGETVDEFGCSESQKDSDNDGITDDIDECPDTTADATVNAKGCEDTTNGAGGETEDGTSGSEDNGSEGEGDGTEDPNTTPGDESENPEPQTDIDNDGVIDTDDNCTDTPSGETVDEEGCSDSQKDSDGDGVDDSLDQCNDTEDGIKIDANGCPLALTTSVPDDNFEQQLINLGYDDILDNQVLTANIENVENLFINGDNAPNFGSINDLSGIEGFSSLRALTLGFVDDRDFVFRASNFPQLVKLSFFESTLLSIIIDENSSLERLSDDINLVGTLDVINNNSLKEIDLEFAVLFNLRLVGNSKLLSFSAFDRNILKATINNNSNLKSFSCSEVTIGEIDFSDNPVLESFRVTTSSDLPDLNDFATCPNLKSIDITGNSKGYSPVSINISRNLLLESLEIGIIGLSALDISNNELLTSLYASGNPNLACIKVNESQLSSTPLTWEKDNTATYSIDCP